MSKNRWSDNCGGWTDGVRSVIHMQSVCHWVGGFFAVTPSACSPLGQNNECIRVCFGKKMFFGERNVLVKSSESFSDIIPVTIATHSQTLLAWAVCPESPVSQDRTQRCQGEWFETWQETNLKTWWKVCLSELNKTSQWNYKPYWYERAPARRYRIESKWSSCL